jgi:ketosteroid isomerase-like protein
MIKTECVHGHFFSSQKEGDMSRTRMIFSLCLASWALLGAFANLACAGALDEARAQAHLKAVAAGDLDALMRDYEDDAYMDWIGGPLDGRYRGKEAIRAVWQKFIAANVGQARPAKFSKLEAYANPKGATIQAEAEYGGTTPVKVWHALTYRDGSLDTEIWQIAPSIQLP